MQTYNWYQALVRPSWAPPSWLFGPVWTFLYAVIAITFGFIFYKALKKEIPYSLTLPFILNLIFNFAFTPLQFGLQNNVLAAIDILLVLATLIWALSSSYSASKRFLGTTGHYLKWVAFANILYLLWVCFATVLQLTITYLNWS